MSTSLWGHQGLPVERDLNRHKLLPMIASVYTEFGQAIGQVSFNEDKEKSLSHAEVQLCGTEGLNDG